MEKNCCRFCHTPLTHTFCDLGSTPPSNSYLRKVDDPEHSFPLHVYVCESCFLVQLPQYHAPEEIFRDYAYFSSFSDSWVEHAKRYVDQMINRFGFTSKNQVIEIASNDGYLLQHFKNQNIPILGIEPAQNVAKVSQEKGIPTRVQFFGLNTAKELESEGIRADLLIGNNVFAHVPDLNDFTAGLKQILKPEGVITLEFPHLQRLMEQNQFDTIYHEHFSYFSLISADKVLKAHGLVIFDVEELTTHGGSLRLFIQHQGGPQQICGHVAELYEREVKLGLNNIATYEAFGQKVQKFKATLVDLLTELKKQGKVVVGYGAPAKGNTLLNYCEVTSKLLSFTVDRSPHKQGCFLPGSRIPIYSPEKIFEVKPDYILVLPWNLKDEILNQMKDVRDWGAKFILPIPEVVVV